MAFPEMTDEWLEFVVDCRRGLPHKYDIVEDPNYNCSSFYEPSYVIARAYQEGGF